MTPAKQLQAIVAKGALIGYAKYPVLATIGYLELWPEHHALFFCEVGDSSTGQQHVLEFDSMRVVADQAILYDARGEVVASIRPYDGFPGDAQRYAENWQEWLLDQPRRRPLDIKEARKYRKHHRSMV